MSIPLLRVFASVALILAMTTGATASGSLAGSHACAGVPDPVERLACYDAAFPPGADAQSARDKALLDFGLNKVQLRVRDPERMRDLSPDQIEATVTRVGYRATGERLVTLDSGQVWLLTEVTSKGPLASGDRVVIREAALGTYMLLTPKRIPLRARRLQ